MKLITKPIDNNYMHFFVNYFKTLQYTSAIDRHWTRNRVFERIDYVLSKYIYDFLETGEIADNFITSEYNMIEGTSSMIPPGCMWISKSGRFSSHYLHDVLGFQSCILWDINRKVALPLLFQDLEGIDEEHEIIFCRTLSNFHFGNNNSPMRINLDWINMPYYCKSFPDDYMAKFNKLTESQQENKIKEEVINVEITDKDLSQFYFFSDFEELLLKSLELLVKTNLTDNEEAELIKSIKSHPDEFEIMDDEHLSNTIYKFTNDITLHDLIVNKFNPDIDDDLPF